jgi:hypothetical protein
MHDQITIQRTSSNVVYNQFGKLDTSNLFQLWGPQPLKGSFLVIGSKEWLNKAITNITLQIHWIDIPKNFADYYKAYSIPQAYTNSSFKVNFSILYKGIWILLNKDALCLFQESENERVVLPISTFQLSINKDWLTTDTPNTTEPLKFDQNQEDCFIKMELSAPDEGFGGGGLYTDACVNATLENAKGNKVEIPLPPYTPKSIGLDVYIESRL